MFVIMGRLVNVRERTSKKGKVYKVLQVLTEGSMGAEVVDVAFFSEGVVPKLGDIELPVSVSARSGRQGGAFLNVAHWGDQVQSRAAAPRGSAP